MLRVPHAGQVVAVPAEPRLYVPLVRFNTPPPLAVITYPPSLKMLFAVTSPIVSAPLTVWAMPGVTPLELLIFMSLKVLEDEPRMLCADVPLKEIEPEFAVNVPLFVQLPWRECEKLPALKLVVIVTDPAIFNAPVAVFVPAPLKVTLLKLPAPMLWAALLLLKFTVEFPGVNVPLLVQLPETVSVFVPEIVRVALFWMVMSLQAAAAPIVG